MVVEVAYQLEERMQTAAERDEEEGRRGEMLDRSMASHRTFDMGRDTSHTCRDNTGDDTRQSFHTSILNCTGETEDDDEEVEEPGSFLFDESDFHSPLNQSLEVPEEDHEQHASAAIVMPPSPASQKTLCCVNDRQWWLDTSLQNVTESFVSLCSARSDDACGLSDWVNATETCSRQLQHQVEIDLLQLLGCDDPTVSSGNSSDGATVSTAWPLLIRAAPPARDDANINSVGRRNPRQRAERIRRLRNELLGSSTQQEQRNVISPTRSVDERLETWIGRGLDPIEQQQDGDEGYDSDPGEVLPPCESLRDTSLLDDEEAEDEYHFYDGHRARVADEYTMRALYRGPREEHDREIYQAVQEAMNVTWTLIWHAERNPFPMCIRLWIERGTMLNHGTVVVEPKFMWRQVYQPTRERILNESTCKPMDVRVLNAYRIVEAGSDLDRTKYPIARSACSFFLKTCAGHDKGYLFEASSPEEKEQVMHQWKLVVARLASLAVTEDMEAMAKEFFTPAVTSQMLLTTSDDS